MRRAMVIGFASCALILAGCRGPAPTAVRDVAAPDGWHWESYRDAEVAVPDTWVPGNSTTLLHEPCMARARGAGQVARPGLSYLVGCGGSDRALVADTGAFVAFTGAEDTIDRSSHGDRVVRGVGAVLIAIQAPEPLRSRIAATAHLVHASDAHGCPPRHPIQRNPAWRPSGSTPIDSLSGVTGISACRYRMDQAREVTGYGLMSSTGLNGDQARGLLAAVALAPNGGGPNKATDCLPEASWGSEAMVALVHRTTGPDASFVMRYAGCDHNGIDDGFTLRRLTAADAPLVAGGNEPDLWVWSGPGKGAALGRPEVDQRKGHRG